VAGGRRGDLSVVFEILLQLPLLAFPLREAVIWSRVKVHGREKKEKRKKKEKVPLSLGDATQSVRNEARKRRRRTEEGKKKGCSKWNSGFEHASECQIGGVIPKFPPCPFLFFLFTLLLCPPAFIHTYVLQIINIILNSKS